MARPMGFSRRQSCCRASTRATYTADQSPLPRAVRHLRLEMIGAGYSLGLPPLAPNVGSLRELVIVFGDPEHDRLGSDLLHAVSNHTPLRGLGRTRDRRIAVGAA